MSLSLAFHSTTISTMHLPSTPPPSTRWCVAIGGHACTMPRMTSPSSCPTGHTLHHTTTNIPYLQQPCSASQKCLWFISGTPGLKTRWWCLSGHWWDLGQSVVLINFIACHGMMIVGGFGCVGVALRWFRVDFRGGQVEVVVFLSW